jgi:hypothetical protein
VRMREGRGVSGEVASKGVGCMGRWLGDTRGGRVHGDACKREVRGREGVDKRGPLVSRRGCAGEWGGADRRDPLEEGKRGNGRASVG